MPGHLRRARAAALAALLAACSGPAERVEPALPIEEDAYVQIMARLDLLRRSPVPSVEPETREARADSARAALLAERGIEPEHLIRFAQIVGSDPARMEKIAERIAAVSDSLRSAAAAAARDSVEAARDSLAAAGDSGPAIPGPVSRDPVTGAADSPARPGSKIESGRVPAPGSIRRRAPAAVPDTAGASSRRLVPGPERRLRPPSRPPDSDTARDSGTASDTGMASDSG